MPAQLINCEQGTEEWFEARLGIVTMSEVQSLLVNGKDKSGFGKAALTYMNQLIGERITGESADQFTGNATTRRGHEYEDIAISLYTERTGVDVESTGIFINHGVGYSPDGIIGESGLVEVKSKVPKFLCDVILGDVIPDEHVAQCQGGLWVSEREWIDFIGYWPGMPLFVKRSYRNEEKIREISEAVNRFEDVLNERMNRIIQMAA